MGAGVASHAEALQGSSKEMDKLKAVEGLR